MNTQIKLLDKARSMCVPPTDMQLAKKLGVTRSAVSLWRSGNNIKDGHLMALIKLAQADPALAVLVRTEGADPATKKAWEMVWDRLSPVTTVIGGLVLAIGMMPAAARAKPVDIQGLARVDLAYSVYYVRLLAWLSHVMRQHRMPSRKWRFMHA